MDQKELVGKPLVDKGGTTSLKPCVAHSNQSDGATGSGEEEFQINLQVSFKISVTGPRLIDHRFKCLVFCLLIVYN